MAKEEKRRVRWIKHYNSAQKLLLVGEGDFSFSACLARAFGSGRNMVATCLHSQEVQNAKHWTSEAHLEELEGLGCLVLHEVDVYEMSHHPILKHMKFDVVVYNFPHAGRFYGYTERDEELIEMHKLLLRAFFKSAREMLNQGGEVHVAHRDDYPYNTWDLENLAAKSVFSLKKKVRFERGDYPGYHNRRGGDINCNDIFPLQNECFTFKFGLHENSLSKNEHDDADLIACRYLTMQRVHEPTMQHLRQYSFAKYKIKKQKRRAVEFEVGDFVYAVLTKDRFLVGEYHKLACRQIGPFEIVDRIDALAYRLKLPSHIRTLDVFDVRHLIPLCGDDYDDENANLRARSLQPWEDDADLIACRYLDLFEYQAAKYKRRGTGWRSWITSTRPMFD